MKRRKRQKQQKQNKEKKEEQFTRTIKFAAKRRLAACRNRINHSWCKINQQNSDKAGKSCL